MKADYKNWMPKGMVLGTAAGAGMALILYIVFGLTPVLREGALKTVLSIVFLVLTIFLILVTVWMILMYRVFSYNGKRQMSKHIIEGVASYVNIPDGGKGLDIGCGSGALAIACAKRNPKASMIGIDRWGKEYASFSKELCESNSRAEGVNNISFAQGDATHLDFADETFDAVTSNYVYHNIPVRDRQAILLETLRTLKKGGTFAVHDIMSKGKYGDMQVFVRKLKDMGYEEVKLIDTTNGMFMSSFEAMWMGLSGSTILVGRK
ncbi:MAG: class I SAM-dependent methyltransferase [Lachnospiraceae bacterium]|nr:class I SAM-dependent methyltransferase [Lachnospiraceae bacterium]